MSEVLLLWLARSPIGTEIVEAEGSGVRLVRCSLREVPAHALEANGVIAVVDDDHDGAGSLGAMVDEVVRRGDLTNEELARVAVRAAVRARARLRALDPAPCLDEADAMGTLLEWITIELAACMSGAVLEGELLEANVQRMIAREASKVHDELAPSAEDTLEMLDTVRVSFRRMQEVLQAVRALSGSDGSGSVALGPLCQALARIMESRAIPVADILLEVDAMSVASIRTGKLVAVLVLLASDALDRARQGAAEQRSRGRIVLRAYSNVADGTAVVEIEQDADDAYPRDARTGGEAGPIARVRNMLEGTEGDAQLASAPGKTTVRLVLPIAPSTGTPPELGRLRASRKN